MPFCSSVTRTLLKAAACGAVVACSTFAAPISGTVNFSGSVTDSGTVLTFTPSGAFTITDLGNTGTFAGLSSTTGVIQNLDVITTPVGQSVSIPDFITFSAAPNLSITLDMIDPGDYTSTDCFAAPAAGQTCTLPPGFGGAPATQPNAIDLSNTATGSTASLSFTGAAIDSATGSMSAADGILTAQFTVPYQTLLADIASGSPVPTSYSATLTATVVPEPSTLVLLGCGLIAVSTIRRYRKS